ncbi:MAG: tRNA (adenosine(37)-N6)-threonylcarbamoyltransferase complex transferase subunit TsaD [Phycisphaerales bacterium]
MIVLGIESSCDETAAAIVSDSTQVLASVVASQTQIHAEYGGVVPEIASRQHEINILPVLKQALNDANLTLDDLDAIAVGHRPGLVGSLLVGLSAAKALSWSCSKPLIGVDHVHAHLYAPLLDSDMSPEFPALGLVISGGHTSLYRMESPTKLSRLGATIDDAIGEAFDKAASILNLPYPGGPHIDRLAQDPEANERVVDFPISRLGKESLDFSYSGLKTALLYAAKGKPNPPKLPGKPQRVAEAAPELTDDRVRDLAASFQRAAVQAVVLKVTRALEQHQDLRSIIIGGGVSANTLVRSSLTQLAHERSMPLLIPQMQYCIDNAAMIAGLGSVMYASGHRDDLSLSATPTTSC